MMRIFVTFLSIFISISTECQSLIPPVLKNTLWDAHWIQYPEENTTNYGIYHFRKKMELEEAPQTFIIHISADNRYILYINNKKVCMGPERSDLMHWKYESVDIAPYLDKGQNIVAVTVWNHGKYRPLFQHSLQSGLIIQGNSVNEKIINTDNTYKVFKNSAYSPETEGINKLKTFAVVGPGEIIDGRNYPWGWKKSYYNDGPWNNAREITNGKPAGIGADIDWALEPRSIPFMEEKEIRIKEIERIEGLALDGNFIEKSTGLVIPRGQKIRIILDHGHLTTAFPHYIFSKGNNARIKITYSETLYDTLFKTDNINLRKGHRDTTRHKIALGHTDIIFPEGGYKRKYTPLWFRTFRYIQLDIETKDQALKIEDVYGTYTAYPFKEAAYFKSSSKRLDTIWKTGWRTARLCAHETYEDCPYYEQLQYIGDTRIQALISQYVSGDTRLMKKAILSFYNSMTPEGLTKSRYPCHVPQIIPPYSLIWIYMLYDYYIYTGDKEFTSKMLPLGHRILKWFTSNIDEETGILGPLPYWNFVDWAEEWPWKNQFYTGGVPPGATMQKGESTIITLQFLFAIQYINKLHSFHLNDLENRSYLTLENDLMKAINVNCWDSNRHLYADSPEKKSYSQHTNIFAFLTGMKTDPEFMQRVLQDKSLIQTTLYFKFYLFRAIKKAGIEEQYIELLKPWYDMIHNGLTTFAEKPDPTRSDCHAWSASPLYDFFTILAGFEPVKPGYRKFITTPSLGNLKWIEGEFPTPQGKIYFSYKKLPNQGLEGRIYLPNKTSGELIWRKKTIKLKPGMQIISIK